LLDREAQTATVNPDPNNSVCQDGSADYEKRASKRFAQQTASVNRPLVRVMTRTFPVFIVREGGTGRQHKIAIGYILEKASASAQNGKPFELQ